jgi:hypothetical protein
MYEALLSMKDTKSTKKREIPSCPFVSFVDHNALYLRKYCVGRRGAAGRVVANPEAGA